MGARGEEVFKLIRTEPLVKDPKQRLGAEDGALGVKQHFYFAKTNWELLEQGKVKPPFVPNLRTDGDTSCFDAEFTNLKPEITKIKLDKEEKQCMDNFPEFSFTAYKF